LKIPRSEHGFEEYIIQAIRKGGGYVKHIDCTVDGFPDLFVVMWGMVIQVEIKYGSMDDLIKNRMEITQPPVLGAMGKAGHKNLLIALCDGRVAHLMRTDGIMELAMNNGHMYDLPQVSGVDISSDAWPEEFVIDILWEGVNARP
jgi:hypothetical protein